MNRYPGIRPFTSAESPLFFGRTDDTERLLRLIRLEKLVILYGKSGYGKSSLLRAGIYPRLLDESDAPFREIRLGPYKPGESQPPAQALRAAALSDTPANPALDTLFSGDNALWLAMKRRQMAPLSTPDRLPSTVYRPPSTVHHLPPSDRFILFFDQFEELFTYPQDQILEFKKQLAEALYTLVPDRYGRVLAKNPEALGPETRAAFFAPLDLKVVFSIRADRMSLLNGLKDYLPNLLQHTYELDALTEEQAREAVVLPATLVDPTPATGGAGFATPPFGYSPDTLGAIFAALRDERDRIETSTLQIVCKHVEDNIVKPRTAATPGRADTLSVSPADLGDIAAIFRNFYENTIAGLSEADRAAARRLVEDVLVSPEGLRLPFAAPALARMGYAPELLETLARASLLRVERDEQGRMIYEVGHDTLVAPIHEAAKARREQETKERLQREADEQRREKEKAVAAKRRARLVAVGATALAAVALIALFIAWKQYGVAQKALNSAQEQTQIAEKQSLVAKKEKQEADRQRVKADSAAQLAQEKTRMAEQANIIAQQNLQKATQEEAKAKAALIQVEKEKAATEEQRRAAQRNYELAQEQTKKAEQEAEKTRQALLEVEITTAKVVQGLLRDASTAIHRLDYETARDRLHDAAELTSKKNFDNPLGRLRPAIADSLMEPAYFLAESGNYAGALFEIGMIAMTLSAYDPADTLKIDTRSPEGKQHTRNAIRTILQTLCPAAFQAMDKKYYPVMRPVAGGEFWMGCDSTVDNCNDDELPRHLVRLNDYELAETETSFWQYNLYLTATGRDIFKDHPALGWGFDGDNPVVNVSWYDAAVYANWLSDRFERAPAYRIDSTGRGQSGWNVERISGADGFCLPTEAEWEYAARGGAKQTDYPYAGANRDGLDDIAWWGGNSNSRTQPVRTKQPNTAGFYDLSGNVWEWCWDWKQDDYYAKCADQGAVTNPRGPEDSRYGGRCLRGGSWYNLDINGRLSNRFRNYPYLRNDYFGFRLARH